MFQKSPITTVLLFTLFILCGPAHIAWADNCSEVLAGSLSNNHVVRSVTLDGLENPAFVLGPPSFAGGQPTTVRVRSVVPSIQSSSASYNVQEWEYLDGAHAYENIGYLALPQGPSKLGCLPAEAGTVALSNSSWKQVNFAEPFPEVPVVIAQVASFNESQAVTTRIRQVTAQGFQVRMQEEEALNGLHATESVHWIAVAPGVTSQAGKLFVVGSTGSSVTHQFATISFGRSLNAPVLIAGMQTTNGGDTAALRHRNLTATQVEVKVEEEKSADSEIGHTLEDIGYIAIGSSHPLPLPQLTQFNGGVNFMYYDLGIPRFSCERGRYNVIKYYDPLRIPCLLRAMYEDGMRSLRIGIYYRRDIPYVDPPQPNDFSHGGNIPLNPVTKQVHPDYIENLKDFLGDIKTAGFERIVFALFPIGASNPISDNPACSTTDCPLLVAETMGLLKQVIGPLDQSGLDYLIDLRNEGITIDTQTLGTSYARDLWTAFRSDSVTRNKPTVGFSVNGDGPANIKNRIGNAPNVYGIDFPQIMSIHLYDRNGIDAGTIFEEAVRTRNLDLNRPGSWIISETDYTDTASAASIAQAIQTTGETVLYLTQWPQCSENSESPICPETRCDQVSVGQPVDFSTFACAGF